MKQYTYGIVAVVALAVLVGCGQQSVEDRFVEETAAKMQAAGVEMTAEEKEELRATMDGLTEEEKEEMAQSMSEMMDSIIAEEQAQ
jgi:hypothetical protein